MTNRLAWPRLLPRLLYLLLVLLFLYLPLALLVANSVNASRYGIHWGGFSWEWYQRLWLNEGLKSAAWHSLIIATLAASASTLIGSLTAVALFRYQFRGKQLLQSGLFVVMMTPDIVMAIALLVLFSSIGIHLGFISLLLAHITFCLPFVVATVYARLRGFDHHLIDAARDLGASDAVIFRQILVPLAMPAIIGGWLLAFTLSLDDVIVSSFVTGPAYEILPLRIYSMVRVGVSPEVNALATLLLLASLLLVSLSQWLIWRAGKRLPASTVTGATS